MNKVLQRYNASQSRTLKPTDMVGTLFLRCSRWMDDVAENIEAQDYFKRFENSEKVILTLTNLVAVFDDKSENTKGFVKEIKDFCMLILNYITEINQRENLSLCRQTSMLLKEMGEVWQKAA